MLRTGTHPVSSTLILLVVEPSHVPQAGSSTRGELELVVPVEEDPTLRFAPGGLPSRATARANKKRQVFPPAVDETEFY